jgi:hypothetical protein
VHRFGSGKTTDIKTGQKQQRIGSIGKKTSEKRTVKRTQIKRKLCRKFLLFLFGRYRYRLIVLDHTIKPEAASIYTFVD